MTPSRTIIINNRLYFIKNRLHLTTIVINLVIIVLQAFVINYLYHLDNNNCQCAMDFRRIYIIVFLTIVLLESLIMIIPPIYKRIIKYIRVFNIIRTVMFVAFVINIVFVYQYIKRLKDKKCECSESGYRTVLYVENIINICLMTMGAIGGVYICILIYLMSRPR